MATLGRHCHNSHGFGCRFTSALLTGIGRAARRFSSLFAFGTSGAPSACRRKFSTCRFIIGECLLVKCALVSSHLYSAQICLRNPLHLNLPFGSVGACCCCCCLPSFPAVVGLFVRPLPPRPPPLWNGQISFPFAWPTSSSSSYVPIDVKNEGGEGGGNIWQ
jgi:hypothetical protein